MSGSIHDQLQDALQRGYVAAYRILKNRDASREACQEAAARALAAKDRYDPSRPFYPWFYRILKNHCFDVLAANRRVTATDEDVGTSEPVAETRLLDNERAEAVTRAIERLPDDLREIIELRHFQGLTYEQMADVLECPAGTVMSRLYRARKTLREALIESGAREDA